MLFALVHGTFANGARWTAPDSSLCKSLLNAYPNARFSRFAWSGDNLESSRQQASDAFVNWLENEAGPDCAPLDCIVIAHSHGGNIVTRACADPRVSNLTRIVICLSTPFIRDDIPRIRALRNTLVWIILSRKHSSIGDFMKCEGVTWIEVCLTFLTSLPGLIAGGLFVYKGDVLFNFISSRLLKFSPLPNVCTRVPILAISHAQDEAFWYLRLLTYLTWAFKLAGLAISVLVLWLVVGEPQTATPSDEICATYLTSPLFAGLVLAASEFPLLLLVCLLTFIFDLLFNLIFGTLIHFFLRGSALIGVVKPLKTLRSLMQIGFGESYGRTIAAPLWVARTPQYVEHFRLYYGAFQPVNTPLLHCSIYDDPGVIDMICRASSPTYTLAHGYDSGSALFKGDPSRVAFVDSEFVAADEALPEFSGRSVVASGLHMDTAEGFHLLLQEHQIASTIQVIGTMENSYCVTVEAVNERKAIKILRSPDP